MTGRLRRSRTTSRLLLGALLLLTATACRKPPAPLEETAEATATPEPQTYAATIEERIEDGDAAQLRVTRVARTNDLWREEWEEGGERWALIVRYDTGKSFLLNLDKRLYIENHWQAGKAAAPVTPSTSEKRASPADEASLPDDATAPAAVNPALAAALGDTLFAEEPQAVETTRLADEQVGDYLCSVSERRARFADGRAEVTRLYRAAALGNLIIRSESETLTSARRVKAITTRRDIRLEVAAEAFTVPADFKPVKRFPGW